MRCTKERSHKTMMTNDRKSFFVAFRKIVRRLHRVCRQSYSSRRYLLRRFFVEVKTATHHLTTIVHWKYHFFSDEISSSHFLIFATCAYGDIKTDSAIKERSIQRCSSNSNSMPHRTIHKEHKVNLRPTSPLPMILRFFPWINFNLMTAFDFHKNCKWHHSSVCGISQRDVCTFAKITKS